MALHKYRIRPDIDDSPQSAPRLADDHDEFIASPVHRLQQDLWTLTENQPENPIAYYPGWFRIGFPLIASIALWGGILWGLGVFR